MNRIQTMSLAYEVLETLTSQGKVSQQQYYETLHDIQNALNISEMEYAHSLDGNWFGAVIPEDIKNSN